MQTKIRQLTVSNVQAIKSVDLRTPIVDIGATFATFEGSPRHVLNAIQASMDDYDRMGMAKGHPRSSLVAVRNKLRDAADPAFATQVIALGEPVMATRYVEVLP